MPNIHQITASGETAVARFPSRYPVPDYSGLAHVGVGLQDVGQELDRLASITRRLQDQSDERMAAERAAKWEAGTKDIELNLFSVDPQDPDAVLPQPRDIEKLYREKLKDLGSQLETDLPSGAKLYFRQYLERKAPGKVIDIRVNARKVATAHEAASLEPLGDLYARNAVQADSFQESQEYIEGYKAQLDRALARGIVSPDKHVNLQGSFEQKVLDNRAEILIKTPEGRTAFYAMDDAGDFARLDPVKMERKRAEARTRTDREESKARVEDERWHDRWRNDYKTEVGALITQGRRAEATVLLDHLEKVRYLEAKDIEHLRDRIIKPTPDLPSDPAVAQNILLDVAGIRPRTTEAQIDALVETNRRGGQGLSLADGVKAKNQLRETRKANEDRTKSEIRAQHGQAEQELRAMLGIRPDLITSVMKDDPASRLYGVLLPELRKRSLAYDGTENPLTVVEEMGPRVRASLGESAILKEAEIRGLLLPQYRDSSDLLKKDRQEGRISEESYRQQLRLWKQLEALPRTPRTPTTTPTTQPPRRK